MYRKLVLIHMWVGLWILEPGRQYLLIDVNVAGDTVGVYDGWLEG